MRLTFYKVINGKEFDNKLLLESLNALWPSAKLIHGKPRKPQSQGSEENANNGVQNILQCILEREGHTHWAKELDKVAYIKNTSLHEVLNNSPYKVLYGRDPPKGLRDFDIPSSLHAKINNVEDLVVILPDLEIENIINDEEGTPLAGDIITPLKSPNCSQLNSMDLNDESDSYSSGGKGESNDYDISMNFDLSSLGATAGQVNEGKSCFVCNFSIGSDFVKCFSCCSIGHKHCFSHDSTIMEGNFGLQYSATKLVVLNYSNNSGFVQLRRRDKRGKLKNCYQILLNIYPRYPLVIIFEWLFQR